MHSKSRPVHHASTRPATNSGWATLKGLAAPRCTARPFEGKSFGRHFSALNGAFPLPLPASRYQVSAVPSGAARGGRREGWLLRPRSEGGPSVAGEERVVLLFACPKPTRLGRPTRPKGGKEGRREGGREGGRE